MTTKLEGKALVVGPLKKLSFLADPLLKKGVTLFTYQDATSNN